MQGLLGMLNNLAQAWIRQNPGGEGTFVLQQVELLEDGLRVVGLVNHPEMRGEVAVRLTVISEAQARQVLHVRVERLPAEMNGQLGAFRSLVEKAGLSLQLDFS